MAKRKPKSQPTWTDVKAKLEDFDRAALSASATSAFSQTVGVAVCSCAAVLRKPFPNEVDQFRVHFGGMGPGYAVRSILHHH
jgi:hypothetical protein